MSGLDNITSHILENAKSEAQVILNDAKEKASEINSEYSIKAQKIKDEFKLRIQNETDRIAQMGDASDRQVRREIILNTRNELIDEIINESVNKIKNMPDEEYKNILLTILKNSQTGAEGEILFSKRDKRFADSEFCAKCDEITNSKLKISDETANIESGFIIRYGKIEQNCSIDAIFEEKHNIFTDLVNNNLTSEG